MIDVVGFLQTGKSVIDLANEIAIVVAKAIEAPDAVPRVLLYLEAARASVQALGEEHQQILTEMRRIDLSDRVAVEALWQRTDTYIHKQHIRPQLVAAIGGLRGCRAAIEKQASGLVWGKADKKVAAAKFLSTLDLLNTTLEGLANKVYPGQSGVGFKTLLAPLGLFEKLRDNFRDKAETDTAAEMKRLTELVAIARSDESNGEWVEVVGRVEELIAQLSLAFGAKGSAGKAPS